MTTRRNVNGFYGRRARIELQGPLLRAYNIIMATDIIKKILLFLGACLVAFLLGRISGANKVFERVVEKTDTLLVFDTIVQYEPIYQTTIKEEKVLVPVIDTVRFVDTLYVYLERESVMWQDSLSSIYISGIQPRVDSVHHFITERSVTTQVVVPKIERTRWGLGIHAGYGAGNFNGKMVVSPYIGIGLSYNIISW